MKSLQFLRRECCATHRFLNREWHEWHSTQREFVVVHLRIWNIVVYVWPPLPRAIYICGAQPYANYGSIVCQWKLILCLTFTAVIFKHRQRNFQTNDISDYHVADDDIVCH